MYDLYIQSYKTLSEIKKDENKLVIWNNIDKKEHDLKSLLWKGDIFEILGIEVVFAVLGHPIIRVIVKAKDETDKTNYGFHSEKVELRTNKFKYFCKTLVQFSFGYILQLFLDITFQHLSYLNH